MHALLIVLASLVLVVLALTAISHLVFHRSLMASVVAVYLRIDNPRVSDDKIRAGLADYGRINSMPYRPPRDKYRGIELTEEYLFGVQMLVFTPKRCLSDTAAIYLAGGGFVRQPRRFHIRFLVRLARRSGVRIISPIYPKAPCFTATDCYERMLGVYGVLRERYGHLSLLGDSSGATVALGMTLLLADAGLKQPQTLVLLSPCPDISLSNPDISRYERLDPLIWASNVRITARAWAGELSDTDPRVSPIFGSLERLACRITLFAGERETLYPDILRLHRALDGKGAEHTFVSARGMNHVYQIYPIPEAARELRFISKIISSEEERK